MQLSTHKLVFIRKYCAAGERARLSEYFTPCVQSAGLQADGEAAQTLLLLHYFIVISVYCFFVWSFIVKISVKSALKKGAT